jgi:polyisoprenoid-binding protein YceI
MTQARNPDLQDVLPALLGNWRLDAAATTVELTTKAMWGMVKVTGRLVATEGEGQVTPDGSVTGSLVLDAASIDTAQAKRDKHLRSKDFFDVEQYPTLRYAATSATSARTGADGALAIGGTFTAHGETHPLTLAATVNGVGTDSITITATADLDRSTWGIGWTKMGARLDNHVVVSAVFTRS